MEVHYQTVKRTFVVVDRVCRRVFCTSSGKEEVHPAIGKEFLGGVDDFFAEDEDLPPRLEQRLAFLLGRSGEKKKRILSDAVLTEIVHPHASIHPPATLSALLSRSAAH